MSSVVVVGTPMGRRRKKGKVTDFLRKMRRKLFARYQEAIMRDLQLNLMKKNIPNYI